VDCLPWGPGPGVGPEGRDSPGPANNNSPDL
jgi:hypothetical protein